MTSASHAVIRNYFFAAWQVFRGAACCDENDDADED